MMWCRDCKFMRLSVGYGKEYGVCYVNPVTIDRSPEAPACIFFEAKEKTKDPPKKR